MMNSSKYSMNSYIPIKPTVKFHDLHTRLQEITFNEVANDPNNFLKKICVST